MAEVTDDARSLSSIELISTQIFNFNVINNNCDVNPASPTAKFECAQRKIRANILDRRKSHLLMSLISCCCSTFLLFATLLGPCIAATVPQSTLPQSLSGVLQSNHSDLSTPIVAVYVTGNRTVNFTHLALDTQSDRLYVGASNWLLQLHSNLTIEESVSTGPIDDSPLCSPTDCAGVSVGSESDSGDNSVMQRSNINQLLLVDRASSTLLVCGTVHQGACRRHRLGAISSADELIPLPVASNDETNPSATLAFTAPARYAPGGKPVLYVAVTNSRLGPYRDMVPAIAARSLEPGPRYLSVIEKSFTDSAKLDIEFHLRDYFLVHYVAGFATADYVYFATVQKRSHLRAQEEFGYVTRLARVCQSDPGFHTYTETSLECRAGSTHYSLLQDAVIVEAGDDLARAYRVQPRSKLLVGVFAEPIEHTPAPGSKSAVCVYPLADIEARFAQNIRACYNGSVSTRNMDYIAGNIPECPAKGTATVGSFCAETLKINGSIPIVASPAIVYNAETLTSVAGQLTSTAYNVLFVGTSRGHLKKLLLSSPRRAEEFEDVTIDANQPILADMILTPSGEHLYVASPYKIAKVLVEHCPTYGTCRSCLNARNPYCGWCSLQKSCTVRSKCIDQRASASSAAASVSRWLSVDSNRCVEFQSIYPEYLPINSLDRVKLVINQLPKLPRNVSYQCVFGGGNEIDAEPMHNGLICQSPPVHQRPKLPTEQDFVTLDLSIRPSDSKTEFLQRKFIFYDCNFYKTCSGCVESRWGCQWCFKENRCVSSGYLCSAFNQSHPASSASSLASPQTTVIRTKEACPSFNLERNRPLNLSLPNGVQREISLPVQNLAFGDVTFGCVIEIEGAQTYVAARVLNGNIICAPTRFAYANESATGLATVTAVWNRVKHIDQVNVTLYKCRYLGSFNDRADCSICLNLPSEYECGWCGSQCTHRSECSNSDSSSGALCPPPRIDWIHPLSGPVQGGTLVTVEGSNLGTSLDEIRDKVLIGGYPCRVQNMSISVRFTCITQSVQKPLLADVVIGNRAGFTTARDKFYYASPEIVGAYPATGPHSGGTRLYITGNNLSTGSTLEVYLDDLPCIVDKMLASSSQISCRTTANPPTADPTRVYEVQRLRVIIDNATLYLERPFRYLPDPTILRIYPLKSFVSGGRSLTVIGTNLDSIQQPRLAVFSTDGQFINDTVCDVASATQMYCPSPPVNAELLELIYHEQMGVDAPESADQKMSLRVGFLMDGVVAVRDLATHYPTLHSELTYVPDPRVFPFEEGIKDLKGDTLVIEGEWLRLASSDAEFNITIGTAVCNLTSLAMSQLVCIPPEVAPDATDESGRRVGVQLPLVVVRIGTTMRQELGYLRYDSSRRAYELSFVTISFGLVFSIILIVFVGVSFVFMRHKSLLAEREYKRIQMQMDTLENSVRSECKQAFAELQTDMTDLSHDLEAGTGTPVLDHRTYVMKVFFPGVDDHPLLAARPRLPPGHPASGIGATLGRLTGPQATPCYNIYELAMAQFEQLIHNKSFLLCFIGTLEASPTFNIRDRVNVASLLMVILMERMEYATDILRTLVLQLVEKSVTSRYPQLMLRRTESIVEKMLTNWLALTMYDYLKNYAGGRLFMLFAALKHQVEKGPIDAMTHDARYSLSEERLLREHYSNYEQILINIFRVDAPMEKHPVRCNDCDTITQLKGKVLDALWKAVPYSARPSVNEIDLEWRDPMTGLQILLQDTDHSSGRDHNGWQRLNTLKHYGVKSGALVMIVGRAPAAQHIYHQPTTTLNRSTLYSTGTKKSSSFYPLLAASPNSCSSSYPSSDVDSDHYWHLAKPTSDDASKESSSSSSGSVLMHKAIPEIFLTRLLSTKGTIQKFVDDFFGTILSVNENLPISIKWIFDLLDEAALVNGIDEPEIIHAWKSNCLPLRFWVNFIKNPNFIVDVNKTPTLDSNLSVVAQTLMDSCSSADPRLGKDSPSSKLLFAKDIVNYRKQVLQFYEDIYRAPQIREPTLSAYMQNLSMAHQGEFDSVCALKELFVYALKYSNEIVTNLQQCDYLTQQTCLEKFINLINYKF